MYEIFGISIGVILLVVGGASLLFKRPTLAKGKAGQTIAILFVVVGLFLQFGSGLSGLTTQTVAGGSLSCTFTESESLASVDTVDNHLVRITGTDAQLNDTTFAVTATCVRSAVVPASYPVTLSNPVFKDPVDPSDVTDYYIVNKGTDSTDSAWVDNVKVPTVVGYAEADVSNAYILNMTLSDGDASTEGISQLEQYKSKAVTWNIGNEILTVEVMSTSS